MKKSNEDELSAAYRELNEETGIKFEDINLVHIINFQYILDDFELEVYAGKLNKDVDLIIPGINVPGSVMPICNG